MTDQPQRPLRSERPSERVMREMAEAEARPTQEPPPLPQVKSIVIHVLEEPSDEDWKVLTHYLTKLQNSMPIMDLHDPLLVRIVPVAERERLKEAALLPKLPVVETTDCPGSPDSFTMWHFADGSDSEG
jgi:hypothetical protein